MKKKAIKISDDVSAILDKETVTFIYDSRKYSLTNAKLKSCARRLTKLSKKIAWEEIKVGTPFTAYINGDPITGKIQKEGERIFLCQNKRDGDSCSNKLKYKFSWSILQGTPEQLAQSDIGVSFISFTKTPEEELKELPKKIFGIESLDGLSHHTVVLLSGRVKVGCQTIQNDKIKELVKMLPK